MHSEINAAVVRYLASFGRRPEAEVIAAYTLTLSDCEPKQVSLALNVAMRRPTEFPLTAGQLRELAVTGGQGASALAQNAWRCLNLAIDKFGSSRSVNFRDAVINAVIRSLGGWERICTLPTEEFEKWFRKDFERLYSQFSREGCPVGSTAPLIGWVERENARYDGLPNPKTEDLYLLPPVEEVGADYEPATKSLPAPPRSEQPRTPLLLRNTDEIQEPKPPAKPRLKKKDIPRSKRYEWTDKSDLEYELSQEQIEQQEENKRRLQAMLQAEAGAVRNRD